MQITLNQDEIEESTRNHVLSQLAIREDQEVSIDLRAGRGENGFTATLDVRARLEQTSNPESAPARIRTPVQIQETQPAHDAKPEEGSRQEMAPKAREPPKPAAPGPRRRASSPRSRRPPRSSSRSSPTRRLPRWTRPGRACPTKRPRPRRWPRK